MGIVQRTLRHTLVYVSALTLSRGVAYLLIPLYTRVLAKPEVANWDLGVASLLFLTPFLELGFNSGLMRFYHYFDSDEDRGNTFSTCFTFLLIVQAVALTAIFTFSHELAALIFGSPDRALLVKLVGLQGAMTVLSNQPLAWFRGQERSLLFAGLNLARAAVGPLCIVLFVVHFGAGVEGVVMGDLAGLTALAVAGYARCWRLIRFRLDQPILRLLLAYGLPYLPGGIGVALLTGSDRYFLRHWAGPDDLAVFAIGAKVGILVQLIGQSLQTAYPPAAMRLAKEPNGAALNAQLLRVILLALCAMALSLSAAGPEILAIMAPREGYGEAVVVIPFIALSFAMHSAVYNVLTGFAIARRTIYNSAVICSGGAVKLLLNFLLIGTYGMIGAAAGTLAAFAFELALAYGLSQLIYPLPHDWRRFTLLWVFTFLTLAALLAGALTPGLPGLLVRIGALSVFALAAYRFLLLESERTSARNLLKTLRARIGSAIT